MKQPITYSVVPVEVEREGEESVTEFRLTKLVNGVPAYDMCDHAHTSPDGAMRCTDARAAVEEEAANGMAVVLIPASVVEALDKAASHFKNRARFISKNRAMQGFVGLFELEQQALDLVAQLGDVVRMQTPGAGEGPAPA